MQKDEKKVRHFIVPLLIGLCIGIVVKLFVIDFLHISGRSMEPAIKDGETVLVNKLAYGLVKPGSASFFVSWAEPKAGDIVIYLHANRIVVKRCVAVAGAHLEYSSNSGYSLFVGDLKIELTKEQYELMRASSRVPDGYILALGDNYAESIDSRNYGFVSVKNVVGRIINK